MGLKITPDMFFKLLMNPTSHSKGVQTYQHWAQFQFEIQSRFSLIAVVLHDPTEHHAIEYEMQERFYELDRDTGDKFLFVTFSDIPTSGKRSKPKSSWQNIVAEAKGNHSYTYCEGTELTSNTCLVLSEVLGIPIEYFPCLILLSVNGLIEVGNLRRPSSGAWVSLQQCPVSSVLTAFAEFAPSANANFELWDFQRLMGAVEKKMRLKLTWALIDEQERVANALGRLGDIFRIGERDQLMIEYAKQNYADIQRIDFLNKLILLGRQQEQMRKRGRFYQEVLDADHELIYEGWEQVEHCEYAVKVHLQSARNLFLMIRNSSKLFREEIFDFSSVVVSLAKSLEIFLNSSVVQAYRSIHGIPMPAFFRRVYEPTNCDEEFIVSFGNRKINLNASHHDSKLWKPLSLGTLEMLQGKYWKHVRKEASTLSQSLEKLRILRNPAAHSEIISLEEALSCLQLVKDLLANPQFKEMIELANALQFSQGDLGDH